MCSFFISLQVWNCETGIVRLTFQVPSPGSFANSCIFSEDSSMILFGGNDKVVYVYDNNTGDLISRSETCGCIIAILGTAGKYVIYGYYKSCCLFNVVSWEVLFGVRVLI
jgi:WD40 repeat protein